MIFLPLLAAVYCGGVAVNAQNKPATRPSNATICDYYAIQKYGENTTASQGKLMQSVVSLAFAGRGNLADINPAITGILSPGAFENEPVSLKPWFNGSIDSTNLNNQPVGIDWLDGGDTDPLYAFLNGSTDTVKIEERTNEFRLFAHFFRSFAFVFGCTQPPARIKGETGNPLSLAYVHKFMELNHTHLGHFINQLTLAAVHFGFSVQDSNTLETLMNARYNVRCQPGITLNPAQGPQLFSLCQAESCPLAAPVADCESYVDLGPQGAAKGASASGSVTAAATPNPTTLPTPGVTTSTTPSLPPNQTNTSATTILGGGPIAGIAIGGAALTFAFVALLVFLLRKRRQEPDHYHPGSTAYGGSPANPSYVTQDPYSPRSPYQGPLQPYTPTTEGGHMSFVSPSQGGMQERQELWSSSPAELPGGGVQPVEKSKVQ